MGRTARKLEFSGVFASTVTAPRKGTHEIDFVATLDLIDVLTDAGLQGVALLGAAGEFLHYSLSDRERLIYLANKRTRIPLLAGVTHSTFAGSIDLASEATSGGADALLVMMPHFYRYGQDEIATFFREFAKEVGNTLPILINNEPAFTSPIDMETIVRLLDTGLFAGVVDASGDWSVFAKLVEAKRSRPFALLCGDNALIAHALCEGADAAVSSAACAVPELLAALDRAIRKRDSAKVKELDETLAQFLQYTKRFPFPSGVKRAMELRKSTAGASAVPLSPQTCDDLKAFDAWFPAWLTAMKETARRA